MSSYLGQNFLTDTSVITRIASQVKESFSDLSCTTLIEIGPGKGALTKKIMDTTSQMLVIEYDEKMVEYLTTKVFADKKSAPRLIHEDILTRDETNSDHFPYPCDLSQKSQTLVVGNLPYYITSPILRKFFSSTAPTRAGGVFLIQKEVAEKIVHDAPKKSFLRWLINYAYRVEYCFSVPPSAFTPPPKVTSAVIRVLPKTPDGIPSLSYSDLLVFLDQYSPFKRKTLGASHKIVEKLRIKNGELKTKGEKGFSDSPSCDVSEFFTLRLEELGWDEMTKILSS